MQNLIPDPEPVPPLVEVPNTETYRLANDTASLSTREPIRIILIGSPPGVNLIIGILHGLGFAEPRAWSKPQMDPTTGKPMRVLTKWIRS
jgi:hypothetical protein